MKYRLDVVVTRISLPPDSLRLPRVFRLRVPADCSFSIPIGEGKLPQSCLRSNGEVKRFPEITPHMPVTEGVFDAARLQIFTFLNELFDQQNRELDITGSLGEEEDERHYQGPGVVRVYLRVKPAKRGEGDFSWYSTDKGSVHNLCLQFAFSIVPDDMGEIDLSSIGE